jgi:hypothetical protein
MQPEMESSKNEININEKIFFVMFNNTPLIIKIELIDRLCKRIHCHGEPACVGQASRTMTFSRGVSHFDRFSVTQRILKYFIIYFPLVIIFKEVLSINSGLINLIHKPIFALAVITNSLFRFAAASIICLAHSSAFIILASLI